MFEAIVTLQEQPEQAQEERCEHPAQGPSDPSSVQQPEGKPRCIIFISNYATIYIYIYIYIFLML